MAYHALKEGDLNNNFRSIIETMCTCTVSSKNIWKLSVQVQVCNKLI